MAQVLPFFCRPQLQLNFHAHFFFCVETLIFWGNLNILTFLNPIHVKRKPNFLLLKSFLLLFGLSTLFCCHPVNTHTEAAGGPSQTLLSDYVHSKDPNFRYELVHSTKENGYTYHVARMVSQHWLSPDLVDEVEWWHWVSVVVPDNVPYQTGMMFIGGGSQETKMPDKPAALILEAATQTNSIVAQVHNIPFQPLTFAGDTVGKRKEDALIAYGWRKFMEGGAKDEDAIWLARLPMTKAVVSAMDVVSELVQKEHSQELTNYVVAGASKRGWTTWTTAAVDDRVVGMVPIVIDLLNLVPSFQHHWRNYGFWAPAVGNYVEEGIMDWMGTREFDRLLQITEPYSFLPKYKNIPKLLISATGDQFFLPDSWQFYWDDLPGEKQLQYVPNAGHDVGKSDALQNMIAFYGSILQKKPFPQYTWKGTEKGFSLETDPNLKPASLKIWEAHNEETRDFRIDVLGPNWTSRDIPINESGKYDITLETPAKGWKGYFVEVTYPGSSPLKFTTGVKVLPQTYPFGPFATSGPKGTKH
jgi:PhoPQ-activated pathogenicity-related protein